MSMEDVLRIANLVIAVVVFSWLAQRRLFNPEIYPRGGLRRDIWSMAFLWALAAIVGTAEQLFNTGTYFRVVCTMAALLTTLSILVRPRDDWPSPDWKQRMSR